MLYLLIVKRCELYGFSAMQNKYYVLLFSEHEGNPDVTRERKRSEPHGERHEDGRRSDLPATGEPLRGIWREEDKVKEEEEEEEVCDGDYLRAVPGALHGVEDVRSTEGRVCRARSRHALHDGPRLWQHHYRWVWNNNNNIGCFY